MKKYILTLALGLVCAMGFAQDYVIVNQGSTEHKYLLKEVTAITHTTDAVTIEQGENVYTYAVADVDSITFVDAEEHVMPEGFEPIEPYIPIYEGDTPPNIEGCYLNSPNVLSYSNYGDTPGSSYNDRYLRFLNQDMVNNTVDYEGKQSTTYEYSTESFITGSDNNFTVFFNVYGEYQDGATYKMAKILSGTKTEEGIANLYYGFYLIEKYDPYNEIVPVGTIRVFKDNDGMSYNATWPSMMLKSNNDTLPTDLAK